MKKSVPARNEFYPPDRKTWRSWLKKNHTAEKNVWLILYGKNSGIKTITYVEAVEEALCFGWIDSRGNKRDQESHFLLMAQRSPKSKWSKLNRERVERLIKNKQMTKAGMAMIDIAKKTGTWEALTAIDNEVIPDDLQKAFNKNKKALTNFKAFPSSARKIILLWIMEAKRDETRKKRIKETVELAAKNIRANHWPKIPDSDR